MVRRSPGTFGAVRAVALRTRRRKTMDPMTLCLIPARGGSKRIPRKNLRPFAGRPMIEWPLAAARASGLFDAILVSTDDAAIADLARTNGAGVIDRPAALADDHATTRAVVLHALDTLEAEGRLPDALCCLYATAPFVRAEDLAAARALLDGADFAVPVARYPFPIERAVRIRDGRLAMDRPEHLSTRSQDLEESFHDAGQFYWGTPSAWRGDAPIFGPRTAPLVLPAWRVQDIDTEEDWTRAEAMFRALGLG